MTDKEKVAQWMIQKGYATGHGDTVEDMLKELEWQIAERKREWQTLTGNEAKDFYEKYTDKEQLIYAIDKFLEEKNT